MIVIVTNMRVRERRETFYTIEPDSYPVAITTVSKRKRSRSSGAREELWEEAGRQNS